MRIKTNILIAAWIMLLVNLGLIARIDNTIISLLYIMIQVVLVNKIRKRLGIEVK